MQISDTLLESLDQDNETYLKWLTGIGLVIEPGRLLAGPDLSPEYPVWPRYHDNFHFPLGMKKLLASGFSGIRDQALKNAEKITGNQRKYLLSIHRVYKALTDILADYAKAARQKGREDLSLICGNLAVAAPGSFVEACQLYWFAAVFRIGTSTIGRMDQHLYPFYQADLKSGKLDKKTAANLIAELLARYEKRGNKKGDTLQNLTLGGRDELGRDQTNDLTYIILEQVIKNKTLEPKINIRLHKNSSPHLLELIAEIQIKGTGNCTVFNDEVIIDGLKQYGRPGEVAADYCADGCSEIILDGYGETWFRYVDCVKAVEQTLFNGEENLPQQKQMQYYDNTQDRIDVKAPVPRGIRTGNFLEMRSFEQFYKAYLKQLKNQVEIMLKEPYNSDKYPLRSFTAASLPGVLEKAVEPYVNPDCYHTYGLFIGSLGTAANSLAAVKDLVFEKKLISREELLSALRNNYEEHEITRQVCKKAPKYGNDDDYVDRIAVDIARKFAGWVREHKERMGRPILPGLYNHLFHHTAYSVGATPDGRKYGEPVGEHLSPTPGTALHGPTAIIDSICKINTKEQIFGSTLHLNIPGLSLMGVKEPKKILEALTRAFCLKKGCVMNLTVLDARTLIEAQEHPEKFEDLMVRVWGFSYYFTRLSKEMQDHVIARYSGPCAD